jgi:hypothetical protein
MYNAHGTSDNHYVHGSTRLHLDVTGAINIMLYATCLDDGRPGGAIWHIFPLASQFVLREFLRNERTVEPGGPGDPIHNQTTYLTPALLELLDKKHGIRPYIFHQTPGDTIFIPASCPHQVSSYSISPAYLNIREMQVSNMTDSIKLACDFLDVESLSASHQLKEGFREQRLAHNWPEDVLQFEVTLWHAWRSLYKQKSQLTDTLLNTIPAIAPTPTPNFMPMDINASSSSDNGVAHSKEESRRARRRLNRKQRTDAQRSQRKPGHNCRCPLCPQSGYFNKRGLLHHLWVHDKLHDLNEAYGPLYFLGNRLIAFLSIHQASYHMSD